jgi:hypothetical protein
MMSPRLWDSPPEKCLRLDGQRCRTKIFTLGIGTLLGEKCCSTTSCRLLEYPLELLILQKSSENQTEIRKLGNSANNTKFDFVNMLWPLFNLSILGSWLRSGL